MSEEMTIREHNEQLILEKQALRQQASHREFIMSRLIVALLGKSKSRTFSPAQLEKVRAANITIDETDEGGLVVRLVSGKPAESDG